MERRRALIDVARGTRGTRRKTRALRVRRVLRVFVIVAAASLAGQTQDETTRLLQEYVRIDTSNPPGDTRKAADFVAGVLTIALGLFMAVGDFERARRTVIVGALGTVLFYTLLSLIARVGFERIARNNVGAVVDVQTGVNRDNRLHIQVFTPF